MLRFMGSQRVVHDSATELNIGLSLFSPFSGVNFDCSHLGTESSIFSRPVYRHNAFSRFVISPCALVIGLFSFLDVVYLCFCGDPNPSLEKAVAPHSSTLAWRIPWTEEPGRLQSMGS